MTIKESVNQFGEDIVSVTNEDGSIWSGTKAAYDEQQAEHLTEIPTP